MYEWRRSKCVSLAHSNVAYTASQPDTLKINNVWSRPKEGYAAARLVVHEKVDKHLSVKTTPSDAIPAHLPNWAAGNNRPVMRLGSFSKFFGEAYPKVFILFSDYDRLHWSSHNPKHLIIL